MAERETRQVWLVTGANRGFGRALVAAALDAGHRFVGTVRGEHDPPAHDRLLLQRLDVRDRAGCARVVERAVEQFGRLDVLVNNAGYGLVGAIEEVSEEEARAIIDTDLLGALWLSQAAMSVMRSQGGGHIVQISTVGAVGSMPTVGLHNAAKWGLAGFSEALAGEASGFGVRVTIAELGGLDTEWATASMRFSDPVPAYDDLRRTLFGTAEVPWPAAGTGGGTPPEVAAAALVQWVEEPADDRLRLMVGEDAPAQVRAALDARLADYRLDSAFERTDRR